MLLVHRYSKMRENCQTGTQSKKRIADVNGQSNTTNHNDVIGRYVTPSGSRGVSMFPNQTLGVSSENSFTSFLTVRTESDMRQNIIESVARLHTTHPGEGSQKINTSRSDLLCKSIGIYSQAIPSLLST